MKGNIVKTLKTQKKMDRFILKEIFESDHYTTTYVAYDKKKKCWCYVEVPNVKTSWDYHVWY